MKGIRACHAVASMVAVLVAPYVAWGGTLITVIPYQGTGYRYSVVGTGEGVGFEQPSFDDSAFSVGDAAFGVVAGGCPLDATVRTAWPPETDILVRKTFNLPAGTTDLTVGVGIDNDVQVFLNGVDISGGLQIHDGCASLESFVFSAPNPVVRAGQNLLAVRGHDRGGDAFLDMRVTASVPQTRAPALSQAALGALMFVMLVAGMCAAASKARHTIR